MAVVGNPGYQKLRNAAGCSGSTSSPRVELYEVLLGAVHLARRRAGFHLDHRRRTPGTAPHVAITALMVPPGCTLRGTRWL